jgi:asparagine synthase (glutamine-hydrolysing)
MCGLAGLIAGRDVAEGELRRVATAMADTLVHRGPDDAGTHLDPTSRLALAHRRLAIVDLSPAGAQPMRSASGRWTVVFNGEIYNHRSMRPDLEAAGVAFRGHSDTETLVEAIDQWGLHTALQRTNGMFALAAWDALTRTLFLARDRLGEKPLYWTHQGERFAFASELRALRCVPGIQLDVDRHAAASLLHLSFVPHPETIYERVRQLAPGGIVRVSVHDDAIDVSIEQWWSLPAALEEAIGRRQSISLDGAADELDELLADAVTMRLESDVPLGAFLSGGIDSSLVAALALRAGRGLSTFTVSMPDAGFDESAHAARVARHLGTDHRTVDLTLDEVLGLIPRLPAMWDEPFADPSMLPTALLCATARRHLAVCVGGDGGDEVFAGYNRHIFGESILNRVRYLPAVARRGLGAALLRPGPTTVDRLAARAYRAVPTRFHLPNLGDKVQKAGSLLRSDGSAWESLATIWPTADLGVTPHLPALGRLSGTTDEVEQMMLVDTAAVLPDQMLVKVDRGSMAAGLEVRSPFLDHRVLEWAWRQPMSVKTSGSTGKLVLRRLGERLLPAEIAGRSKMGFDPPLGRWLRGPLRSWADDLLADSQTVSAGLLDRAALEMVWRQHLSGERNWDYRLWTVLMLEAWLAEYPA